MDAVIRTRGLTKRYGRTLALDGLDLEVPRGVVFGYLGPNGAGKTTTIRLLMGLVRATRGDARIEGLDVTADRDRVHARVGYLPGEFVAYPDLTGEQYLAYIGNLRGGVPDPSIRELAERFQLDPTRRIGTLSHGNRQKVGLIQAFMHRPDLLLLDEPTAGFDPLMQREFIELVRETREEGRTVFLSSHILDEVEQLADMVAMLRGGRLAGVGSVHDLRSKATRRIDLTFEHRPPAIAQLRGVPGVVQAHRTGRTTRIVVEGSTAELLRAVAPHGVLNVVTHEPDLEEIFLSYYGDGPPERGSHVPERLHQEPA